MAGGDNDLLAEIAAVPEPGEDEGQTEGGMCRAAEQLWGPRVGLRSWWPPGWTRPHLESFSGQALAWPRQVTLSSLHSVLEVDPEVAGAEAEAPGRMCIQPAVSSGHALQAEGVPEGD